MGSEGKNTSQRVWGIFLRSDNSERLIMDNPFGA
jgi:hypothetical protein